jgi:hypothetical protein
MTGMVPAPDPTSGDHDGLARLRRNAAQRFVIKDAPAPTADVDPATDDLLARAEKFLFALAAADDETGTAAPVGGLVADLAAALRAARTERDAYRSIAHMWMGGWRPQFDYWVNGWDPSQRRPITSDEAAALTARADAITQATRNDRP